MNNIGNVGDNYNFVLKTTDPRHYGPAQKSEEIRAEI